MAIQPLVSLHVMSENQQLCSLLFLFILVFNIYGIQVQHRGVIWLAAFGTMGAMDWDRLFL